MPVAPEVMKLLLLVPMAVFIMYYDLRYRRIPNILVAGLLIGGLTINISFGGVSGGLASIEGLGLAFLPMFLIHLFGAVGAVVGVSLVPLTFVIVVMLGAVLAIYTMMRSGTVFSTLHGVLRIFVGIMPGWEMPRFAIPSDRKHTIPYGVAIMLGSLIAASLFMR